MTTTTKPPTDRVRLRRNHERGHYDANAIHAVLDAMPLCHVGYTIDGSPYVTPTIQWREGDHVYWHGSSASRMLRASEGAEVCLTVSTIDGMVMARSAFHHSANYRAAMLFGTARKLTDDAEITARLKTFIDGMFPGRWDMLRPMNDQELKATTVLTMPIDEASAKIRTGPPIDDDEDYNLPIWAGVIPLTMQIHPAEPDPRNLSGVAMPDHINTFSIG